MTRIARVILMKRNHGDLPSHRVTRHTCDNEWCISPAHVLEGTHGDNARDKVEHERLKSGEALPQSKLNESKVHEIRFRTDSARTLAREFGVSMTTIRAIISRRSWKHI